jgi:hypothetical protein
MHIIDLCKHEGCSNAVLARGLCNKHYTKEYRNGSFKSKPPHKQISPENEYIDKGTYFEIRCYDKYKILTGIILIDTDDVEKCKQYKWYIPNKNKYVVTSKGLKLHTLISGITAPDHRNTNLLDNRKENLRFATNSQNACNKNKQSNNLSGYKGVSWSCRLNKWYVRIAYDYKVYYLGLFEDIDLAALAYNEKAKELHGAFAVLNDVKPKLKRRNLNP